MTTVATSASVRFGAGLVPGIDALLRLNGRTYIDCHVYDDCAPILAITDAQVSVSLTVPDSGQVTEQDVTRGRALAEAVARYVTELERRAALDHESGAEDSGTAAGTAA